MKYHTWQQFPGCNSRGMLTENKKYDKLGRLVKITSGTSEVVYEHNLKNQSSRQIANRLSVEFICIQYIQFRNKK